MSTTKKATTPKLDKRAIYFQQYKIPKKLVIWVPPHVEQSYIENPDEESIMNLVYFIEANEIERINTETYLNDFQEFYNFHLHKYNDSEKQSKFCSNVLGGVSSGYIKDTANSIGDKHNITIMSVNADADMDSTDITVYALISFRLASSSDTLMVETLCGNQTINSEGEGTRLLNFLKKMSEPIGIYKIALHPVSTAVGYYTRENFRKLSKIEADLINSSSSEDDDDDSPQQTMAINIRARKNLNKFKTVARVLGKFTRNKRLKDLEKQVKEIKKFYKAKYDEKTGKRGTPIAAPFSTETIHHFRRGTPVGKITSVKTTNDGTEKTIAAVKVIPGASLYLAKNKAEIQNAALMTQIREANLKAEQAAAEKEAAKKSKSNKSKGNKTASGTRKRRK